MSEGTLDTLVSDYLSLQLAIKNLEADCRRIKDQIQAELPADKLEGPVVIAGASVQWVKGRQTTKVDTKKLRTGLTLEGVDIAIIERTFAQSTTVSEGQPHLRIAVEGQKEE